MRARCACSRPPRKPPSTRARQDGRIADGVRIGGVEVGGLSREEARGRLTRRLVEPLQRTVVVEVANGRTVRLSPDRAHLRLDVDTSIATALARAVGAPSSAAPGGRSPGSA
jgi:hypothetical protein